MATSQVYSDRLERALRILAPRTDQKRKRFIILHSRRKKKHFRLILPVHCSIGNAFWCFHSGKCLLSILTTLTRDIQCAKFIEDVAVSKQFQCIFISTS